MDDKSLKYTGAKLNLAKVEAIRSLIAAGTPDVQIAAIFNMGQVAIRNIRKGKSWIGKPGGCPKLTTHCRAGHPRTAMNTAMRKSGYPECRICRSRREKSARLKLQRANS